MVRSDLRCPGPEEEFGSILDEEVEEGIELVGADIFIQRSIHCFQRKASLSVPIKARGGIKLRVMMLFIFLTVINLTT